MKQLRASKSKQSEITEIVGGKHREKFRANASFLPWAGSGHGVLFRGVNQPSCCVVRVN